jgi:steroid 5-alpha reductase family enzyme
MSFLTLWLISAAIVLGLMILLWIVSLILKNSSIVDIFWGTGFVILFWIGFLVSGAGRTAGLTVYLTGAAVTIWGLRLSLYILSRNAGKPEDFRYAKWREEAGPAWWWRSFFKVFLLQGVIMWLVAAPLVAVLSAKMEPSSCLPAIGALVWLFGFIFEAGGDWQLARFKSDPANKGKLLTTGLWSYTRHPNYFGDAAQWWGFFLLALASGAWWTAFSPAIMTFLLMRVSGVALLEKTLVETKPGYADYIARTPAFFPWFPKK